MQTGPSLVDSTQPKRSVAPRFVPTLTEVVDLPAEQRAATAPETNLTALPEQSTQTTAHADDDNTAVADRDMLRDELVHRVMQRVELALADQLPQALQDIVQAHVQQLVPLLREQIQSTIARAVDDALADEL